MKEGKTTGLPLLYNSSSAAPAKGIGRRRVSSINCTAFLIAGGQRVALIGEACQNQRFGHASVRHMTYSDPFQSPSEPFEAVGRGELKHSGLGIASFAIGLSVGVFECALVLVAGMIEVSTPGGIDEDSPATMLLGLAILACLAIAMLGIGLGVAGLLQRRSKLFAALGVAIGLLVVLGVAGLMVVGLMAQ
jgi:hypothetical protein